MDLSKFTTEQLRDFINQLSLELAKRNGKGKSGRPAILKTCSKCSKQMTTRESRTHKCEEVETNIDG